MTGRILLAAPHSGSGKTLLTCALLRALQRRGVPAATFKCGPDYIDPLFHRQVLGLPGDNLDLFLGGEGAVRRALAAAWGRFAILEGVMGYYDGIGGGARGSSYDIARRTGTPTVLVLRPQGACLTLAAQVKGLQSLRPGADIRAVLLTECRPSYAARLAAVLEEECTLPVLGSLPPLTAARLPARHLGLLPPGEIADWQQRLDTLAAALEPTLRWDLLEEIGAAAPVLPEAEPPLPEGDGPVIAVARDTAFCFLYEENLRQLRRSGARVRFFSPLCDPALPAGTAGLYLPGGYPELYGEQLEQNGRLRFALRRAIRAGLPTVAEGGGYLYLQDTLAGPDGVSHAMVGVLPGHARRREERPPFGYVTLTGEEDSLLLRAGEGVPAHSFHRWEVALARADLTAAPAAGGPSYRCAVTGPTLYAAFPQLYFGGDIPLAARLVQAAARYEEGAHEE